MEKVHTLKVLTYYYDGLEDGSKPFEVRFNDRDFQVGDLLCLNEVTPKGDYTNRMLVRKVTYVLDDPACCLPGYVVLGLAPVNKAFILRVRYDNGEEGTAVASAPSRQKALDLFNEEYAGSAAVVLDCVLELDTDKERVLLHD